MPDRVPCGDPSRGLVVNAAAVAAALGAAGCFAVSTSMQHQTAADAPSETSKGVRLLAHLAHQPVWVVGMATGLGGFVLHALALHLGALTLVQPLLVSGLVLAVPVRAAMDHRLPPRGAVWWAVLTAAGLALFLVIADPTAPQAGPDGGLAGLFVAAGAGVAAVATWAASRARTGRGVALWLGFAAGVLFGLVAGVLKMATVAASTGGPVAVLTSWPLYTLTLLGAWGLAVNQRAYQAAPLTISMPLLNIVDPLVAITFGAYVFGEKPADQPAAVVLEVLGLAMMAGGVAALARFTPVQPPVLRPAGRNRPGG